MKKRIFKYQLETTGFQTIQMREGDEILCIQAQNEVPCIWVLSDPYAPFKERMFEIFGTGQQLPEKTNRMYLGTYQLQGGALVFHCFECFAGIINEVK